MSETQDLPVIPGLDEQDINILLNVKTFKQYCQYIVDSQARKCPFCQLDTKLNKVINTAGGGDFEWRIWINPFPQKHCQNHLIIAPTRHLLDLSLMTSNDWISFSLLVRDSAISLPGGGLLMRFGDPKLNAGSIRHIHANIIVPDGTGEVRLPLHKEAGDRERKLPIIVAFEKMRQGTAFEKLSPEERELVKDRLG